MTQAELLVPSLPSSILVMTKPPLLISCLSLTPRLHLTAAFTTVVEINWRGTVHKILHMLNPADCWVSAADRLFHTGSPRDICSLPSVSLSSSHEINLSAVLFPPNPCALVHRNLRNCCWWKIVCRTGLPMLLCISTPNNSLPAHWNTCLLKEHYTHINIYN